MATREAARESCDPLPIRKEGNHLRAEDLIVGGHERQAMDGCRRCNEAIRRILVRQVDGTTQDRDLSGKGRFLERHGLPDFSDPCRGRPIQDYAPLLHQDEKLPDAYRRQPQLVFCGLQLGGDALRELSGLQKAPKPDVGVEKQSHVRSTSQTASSEAGETMSPRIIPLERKDPNQLFGRRGDEMGTISTTGSPARVISTGWPVRCTFSSTALQTALNFEIAILSTAEAYHDPGALGNEYQPRSARASHTETSSDRSPKEELQERGARAMEHRGQVMERRGWDMKRKDRVKERSA